MHANVQVSSPNTVARWGTRLLVAAVVGLALSVPARVAFADSWKSKSKGYERNRYLRLDPGRDRLIRSRTAEGCEIERKWKNGNYQETVKCKPER